MRPVTASPKHNSKHDLGARAAAYILLRSDTPTQVAKTYFSKQTERFRKRHHHVTLCGKAAISTRQDSIHLACRLGAQRGHDVRIRVHRDRNLRMPKALLDDLGMDTSG